MSDEPLTKPDMPPYELVASDDEWWICLDRLRQEPRLAIDLEANSMYAYREQVCLIQISIPGYDYIIDPLAVSQLDGLGVLIEDRAVEKILHSAEYDLTLLKREYGWSLNNLFDTMWAARILGYDRVGLASLLGEFYGLKLNKRYQRANWCRRPLAEAQLIYAQADTHFLMDLRDRLARELSADGCTEEAWEIFAEQTQIEVTQPEFDPQSFWSIGGARKLEPKGKAVLKALNIYRDEIARSRNRPLFKVFGDQTLLELARKRPHREEELRDIHGMSSGQIQRYGRQLLKIIREHENAPTPRLPQRSPRPPEEVLNRYEALHTWRKKRAQRRGVESDVIVSRDTLWALAWQNPREWSELVDAEILGPFRLRTYGHELIRLLTEEPWK